MYFCSSHTVPSTIERQKHALRQTQTSRTKPFSQVHMIQAHMTSSSLCYFVFGEIPTLNFLQLSISGQDFFRRERTAWRSNVGKIITEDVMLLAAIIVRHETDGELNNATRYRRSCSDRKKIASCPYYYVPPVNSVITNAEWNSLKSPRVPLSSAEPLLWYLPKQTAFQSVSSRQRDAAILTYQVIAPPVRKIFLPWNVFFF